MRSIGRSCPVPYRGKVRHPAKVRIAVSEPAMEGQARYHADAGERRNEVHPGLMMDDVSLRQNLDIAAVVDVQTSRGIRCGLWGWFQGWMRCHIGLVSMLRC